ncbi:MAG: hypothetical protein ACK5PP_04285 [Acidimicrobiales bacterium]
MAKVTFDPPEDLIERLQSEAGSGVDAWVADALRKKLAASGLDRVLAEIADEVGPVPTELVTEADAAWRAS